MNELQLIKSYIEQDLSNKDIAKLVNRSGTFIASCRRELNLPCAKEIRTIKTLNQIRELVNKKLTDFEIGKILNKNYRTISYYRNLINLPPSMPENTYLTNSDRIKGYMIRNSKFTAKRRNIEFNLKYSDFELPEYCPLLNIKLTFKSESNGNDSTHASLDRIDNSKGYIKGNVIVLSRLANAMKNAANFNEIEIFCNNILLLINNYKNQGALGSITDIFPNIKLLEN